jgi:hypothetical protein
MGKFLSALVGVVAGFVLAHLINSTPEGRSFFRRVQASFGSFLRGFSATYRS